MTPEAVTAGDGVGDWLAADAGAELMRPTPDRSGAHASDVGGRRCRSGAHVEDVESDHCRREARRHADYEEDIGGWSRG
jgi:hypothetical protein